MDKLAQQQEDQKTACPGHTEVQDDRARLLFAFSLFIKITNLLT